MATNSIIQLLFIFLPGIVSVIIINYAISTEEKFDLNKGIAYSFILGFISYLPQYFHAGHSKVLETLISKNPTIAINEIIVALAFGLVYAVILTFIINKEVLHCLFRKTKISHKLGKKYLIQGIISSPDEIFKDLKNSWVNIRFNNREQVFQGWIQAIDFNDKGYFEILLRDVDVYYNNSDIKSYSLKAIYLCEKPENIILEYA